MTSSKIRSAPARSRAPGARRATRASGADAARSLDRLDDDRGQLALATGERPLDAAESSHGRLDDQLPDRGRHARRTGDGRVVGPVVGPDRRCRSSERPVTARAARIANIVASVPEFVKRTRSTGLIRRTSSSASAISSSLGAPKAEPRRTWASTASTTAGWAWPRISEV